ncbi:MULTISPECIES: DUF2500 domain-containing protein [unclassified Streptococcus]|uniref:DUF2500 domain-containing protein n=1 Tax=unclassified Streptococcus TaxID=2608887 RepID=UPI001072200F|nr:MULTISPECIES: DUF2500 domain-containing protein [unclassified Streptococcus]MBF0787182.1 DUF2500 domain-containing protein [Streptococcus sp. 19428wC2_LYSM12]MCQ9212102.1 DUF2500 domain-containing protein [Streptococcus sp. B01]MCQ9213431.1 DUF2500 domain-containing protein [Streptococcus sp. O1]TFV05950.1 DUF2500 domain-containing protein [Streptococcus sp. LYSM12]
MIPFSITMIWCIVIFTLVIGGILWQFAKALLEVLRTNAAPKEWHDATLIAKRTHVGRNNLSYTTYYLTFEWEHGERREFRVGSDIYALSLEGDKGELLFQGSRFLDFKRA